MSQRIAIGVVGAGFMGELHCRAYDQVARLYPDLPVGLDVAVVCDVEAEVARTVAERWGIARWTTKWEDVVGDESLGLIDVCTPPAHHLEIAHSALEAGRAVHCEKPVGLNAHQAAELQRVAAERGLVTTVAFTYRWLPALVVARQLIRSGAIGEVVHVEISKESDSAADARRQGWRFDASESGHGSLGDVGSHVFDMARYLVGDIAAVSGLTRVVVRERGAPGNTQLVDTDDLWMSLARFESGATACFQGGRVLRGRKADFIIDVFGSTGAIHWDQIHMNSLELYEDRDDGLDGYRTIRMGPAHGDHGRFVPVRGHSIGFAELKSIEIAHVGWALGGAFEGVPDFGDALAAARIVDAVPLGRWVEIGAGT